MKEGQPQYDACYELVEEPQSPSRPPYELLDTPHEEPPKPVTIFDRSLIARISYPKNLQQWKDLAAILNKI